MCTFGKTGCVGLCSMFKGVCGRASVSIIYIFRQDTSIVRGKHIDLSERDLVFDKTPNKKPNAQKNPIPLKSECILKELCFNKKFIIWRLPFKLYYVVWF